MTSSSAITIQAAIIHRILKLKDQNKTAATAPIIRPRLHVNDEQTTKLVLFLDQELDKYGFAHSISSQFNEATTLSKILNDDLFVNSASLGQAIGADLNDTEDTESNEQKKYRIITNKLTHALHYQIYEELKTTGDHLPIIFYQQDGIDFLYIALLSLKPSITINEDTGEIIDTSMIDTQALKVAFKIKLNDMKLHSQALLTSTAMPSNYISWVKKGNDDIPKYIQKYIPIKYSIDDKVSTRKLMDTLEKYLAQSCFTDNTSASIHEEVLTLLKTKASTKQPINIINDIDPIIANKAAINGVDITANNNDFKNFRSLNGYSSNDSDATNIFSPAGSTLTSLEKFTLIVGNQKQIKISGRKADIEHTIVLNDQDEENPYVKIDIKTDELPSARKVLKNRKPYESDNVED